MDNGQTANRRSKYAVEILERHPKLTLVHHVEVDGTAWATSKRWIVRRKNAAWERVARFPNVAWPDHLEFWRPAARLFRTHKCNLHVNSRGLLFGIRGGVVYAFRKGGQPDALFNIRGRCALHLGIVEDTMGWSYFGEYHLNRERMPIRIWRISPDLESWEVAYEFPAGKIRHVHGMFRDPYEPDAIWVTVGDGPGERGILKTSDRFQTLEPFIEGRRIWPAITLLFTEEYICWLPDSQWEKNCACRADRSSGHLEVGQAFDNSLWYGTTTTEGLHVAFTTVERGSAIHSDRSAILVSEDAFHWQELWSFKKDGYSPRYFGQGLISCPSGEMSRNRIYISGNGLKGFDGCTMVIRITPD